MTITTLGTAAHISPVVIRTIFSHFYAKLKKAKADRHTEATDELLFDEAFNIVKSFIELATHDTVESLQKFANTHVPAPPWATAIPTMVPMESCFQAAECLKRYFGPQDLKDLVGGERWWQIRGIAGVQGEWIAQSADWKKARAMDRAKDGRTSQAKVRPKKHDARHEKKRSAEANDDDSDREQPTSEELDRLQRVMLYVHGGGYYFGSMATHRYQIVRFARKFGGRCFAPIYRKAPQYPWPCALQDCLAAYLFLIRPPPGAAHKPVDPAKLVIAGDSAGGGLSLALLTVLRDLELPMPANTATDIIPPYSFVHKPSTLWPVPGVAPEERQENDPGRKVPLGVGRHPREEQTRSRQRSNLDRTPAAKDGDDGETRTRNPREQVVKGNSGQREFAKGVPPAPDLLYSEPIQVKTSDPEKADIQLRTQIQLYATNAQLTHPLCSPILQGSLGGLPPLYIIAGDAEVLLDEIVYLAHRAAHPQRYPLRPDLMERSERARKNAARFDHQPTKVHLQIYDDMCHVLTLFAFTTQSRYAYRSVASFVKHVTGAPTNLKDPFPDVAEGDVGPEDTSLRSGSEVFSPVRSASAIDGGSGDFAESLQPSAGNSAQKSRQGQPTAAPSLLQGLTPIDTSVGSSSHSQNGLVASPMATSASQDAPSFSSRTSGNGSTLRNPQRSMAVDSPLGRSARSKQEEKRRASSVGVGNEYTGQVPLTRPFFRSHMIRERVNVKGFLRPLEPEAELQALQVDLDEIGRIKEGPCARYLTGQDLWGKKFEKTARKVEKKRAKNEDAAQKLLELAAEYGLLKPNGRKAGAAGLEQDEDGIWAGLGAFGPTELVDETPPPSAIAGRRDTEEALALLRTSLHVRAKQNGIKIKRSKLKIRRVPDQSNAERPGDGRSRKGLRAWNYLMVRGAGNRASARKREKDGQANEDHQYIETTRQTRPRRSESGPHQRDDTSGEWIRDESADDASAEPAGASRERGPTTTAATTA